MKQIKTIVLEDDSASLIATPLVLCNIPKLRSNQMNRIFQIYHNLNWKKAETEFNIRFNNDQKDVWKPDAIPEIRHFLGKTITLTQMKNSD